MEINKNKETLHCGTKPKKIAFGIAPLGIVSVGIVRTIPTETIPRGAIPKAIFFGFVPQCRVSLFLLISNSFSKC